MHNAEDFSSVLRFRCSNNGEFFRIFARPNNLTYSRLGFIVAGKVEETPQNSSISNAVGEAILVLEALGYQKPIAYKAAIAIFNEKPEISINDLVKLSLKKITSA